MFDKTHEDIIVEIRRLAGFKNISDEEITPYIEIAISELEGITIADDKKTLAISFLSLKLLGQKLWHKIQQRASEYDETLETFKDISKWEDFWQARLDKLITKNGTLVDFSFGVV